MNTNYLCIFLQAIVGLTILNVWLLRFGKSTPYRGGSARNMREEFATYGLPSGFVYVIGFLKVGLALALLAGIGLPQLTDPAAIGMGLLMLGAVIMHLKVGDPLKKGMPATAIGAMCVAIYLL